MVIAVDGPAYIFGDKKSVLCNTTILDSTLKKRSQVIAYHPVREGAARVECSKEYVNIHDNNENLSTQVLPMREKQQVFF